MACCMTAIMQPTIMDGSTVDWLWLLIVLAVKDYLVTSWPLALSGAIVKPFTYALCWKLEILQSDVPPEIMLLVIPVG